MVLSRIKQCPPTPFDINQLHVVAALSRQRPRVRVPSTPPFPFSNLQGNGKTYQGAKRARFGALPSLPPFDRTTARPTLYLRIAAATFPCASGNTSSSTAACAACLAGVIACV